MGTILIDKLLSWCVKQRASELYIASDAPLAVSINGQRQELEVDRLSRADIAAVVEWITPLRAKEELRQTGRTSFRFGFGDSARVRAYVGSRDGNLAVQLQLT
jgi:Tfp pilus assembly ATPase PilU